VSAKYPNPLIPGFNPDPSIVRVGDDYYLATSTFEYLPGVPIYHSTDLVEWCLIGHVVTREGQLQGRGVPTAGGAWAPTIRHRDGKFYVMVTDALGRGTLIFTAQNPAGPWSDGIVTDINGIDPDIAWDDNGDCYVTYSGLLLTGEQLGQHLGIMQVKIDVETGKSLEEPRHMWSGTGLMFPEAPHVYKVGEWWYLMIAEGGTERGHSESIARSKSITGPFEGAPNNPILSARSTSRPAQNTGHGDLVIAPDGNWVMVMLGMRTRGMTRAFSSLGRETFITEVAWTPDGWLTAEPVILNDINPAPEFRDDFAGAELSGEWVAVRRFAHEFTELGSGGLILHGEGRSMFEELPAFVGRRQRRFEGIVVAEIKVAANGIGGLSMRYDEVSHYDLEFREGRLLARFAANRLVHEVEAEGFDLAAATDSAGFVRAYLELKPAPGFFGTDAQSSDYIEFGWIDPAGQKHAVTEFDGRFLSAEVTASFTGRVIGMYAQSGDVVVRNYAELASL
jgi:beta-xylosidase